MASYEEKLQYTQYDIRKLPLSKISSIREQYREEILEYRMQFLIDLSLRTNLLQRYTYYEADDSRGDTFSKLLRSARDLLLPSVKKELYTTKMKAFFDQRDVKDSHSV